MELISGEVSSSMGAALGNALLHDFKHLLRPEVDLNRILMDKSKIDRAKAKDFSGILHLQKSKTVGIGIDGKVYEKTFDYNTYEDENGNSLLKR